MFSAVVVLRPKSNFIIGRVTKTTNPDFMRVGAEVAVGVRGSLNTNYRVEKYPDKIPTPVIKQIVFTRGEIV